MAGTTLATPTYAIGNLLINATDGNGVSWGVNPGGVQGWFDGPGVKLNQAQWPRYDGSARSQSFRDVRAITLTGWGKAPTRAAAQAARDAFTGNFAGGGQYTLTVADDGATPGDRAQTRFAIVELGDAPKCTPAANGCEFDWQLILSAVDPRKYDVSTRTGLTTLPMFSGGLDWTTGGGLSWPLNWGSTVSNGTFGLANPGTADTWPVFTLTGPLTTPTITRQDTGQTLAYNDTLAVGDVAVITSSPYNRSTVLNGVIDRSGVISTAQWFSIDPGSLATIVLSSATSGAGSLSGLINPAYW